MGCLRRCMGRCATMSVGAPLVTPGAGTAQGVRGVSCGGACGVSGQSRRCVGHPGDISVAPTLRGVHPRRCGRTPGRAHGLSAALHGPMRDDARRGATCDARCRNGTRCPRRFVRRFPRCFRPIAALRRSSGRHKCRPYAAGCSSTALRRATRAARVASRRCGVCGGRVVSRLVETASRTVFPVAVTVFPVSRPAPLVTASVNVRGLMDFGGGEETFCSTKLD